MLWLYWKTRMTECFEPFHLYLCILPHPPTNRWWHHQEVPCLWCLWHVSSSLYKTPHIGLQREADQSLSIDENAVWSVHAVCQAIGTWLAGQLWTWTNYQFLLSVSVVMNCSVNLLGWPRLDGAWKHGWSVPRSCICSPSQHLTESSVYWSASQDNVWISHNYGWR